MLKKEIIWREILFQAIEKKQRRLTQKALAQKYAFSLSTVFNAQKIPRSVGAIEVSGRFFEVKNVKKLLSIWCTHRNIQKDIIYQTCVDMPIIKIEGNLPANAIPTAYTAYRIKYQDAPADYDKVYFYSADLKGIKKRFPFRSGRKNLIVLEPDKYLSQYGALPPVAQIYADLWNLDDWFANDFLEQLNKKIF